MSKVFFAFVALVCCVSTASAATLSGHLVPSSQVVSPIGGAELDVYTLKLHANPGARISAVDLKVTGGVYQLQVANFIGAVSPTASIDALTGFPVEFINADTHSLIPMSGLIIPPAPTGLLTEDLRPSAGNNQPTAGVVDSWTMQNVAFSAANQLETVTFAQIVLPRGGSAVISGFVASSDDPGGFSIAMNETIGIPEPATMAMAGMGLVGMIGVARRRKA